MLGFHLYIIISLSLFDLDALRLHYVTTTKEFMVKDNVFGFGHLHWWQICIFEFKQFYFKYVFIFGIHHLGLLLFDLSQVILFLLNPSLFFLNPIFNLIDIYFCFNLFLYFLLHLSNCFLLLLVCPLSINMSNWLL